MAPRNLEWSPRAPQAMPPKRERVRLIRRYMRWLKRHGKTQCADLGGTIKRVVRGERLWLQADVAAIRYGQRSAQHRSAHERYIAFDESRNPS